ncbi:MAG: ribosome biogenesis GTPase Der [Gammaproteobacteria bacterium]|nr:ribosome biogenesis GTPase Der [Gammaproteobacteria bacterium]
MLPRVVTLIGRPNVGKSTLFNRLCRTRDALVADYAGLTRDRHYGTAMLAGIRVTLIDTGGLADPDVHPDNAAVFEAVDAQVESALDETDVVVFVVDACDGVATADEDIARRLRRRGADVVVAVNKVDRAGADAVHEFASLGFEAVVPVAALSGRGCPALIETVASHLPAPDRAAEPDQAVTGDGVRVAVAGRPNVGKSTLINRLLGEDRQVVHDTPGTTRDAIDIPFGRYLLIDTAGVRRKGRTASASGTAMVEKFSIVKTLEALERAHVVILVADAHEGIVDQDLHVLDYAVQAGAGVVVAVNKCDGLSPADRQRVMASVDRRLTFAPWIAVRYISALRGRGVRALTDDIDAIHRAGAFEVTTPELNRVLAEAVREHAPPAVRSRPVKLRYAHKAGAYPPRVVIHGNQTEALPASYRRYLASRFRAELGLVGVPVVIETKTADNPYAGKPNPLNRRQLKRRARLIRHRRGR